MNLMRPGAILVRHPVVCLDEPASLDVLEELLLLRCHRLASYLPVVSIECIATRRRGLTRQAARLFAQKGYHGTSMGDLAQAMGVQKGSLYSLTGSKQELLYETMREGAAAFHAGLDAIPEGGARPSGSG